MNPATVSSMRELASVIMRLEEPPPMSGRQFFAEAARTAWPVALLTTIPIASGIALGGGVAAVASVGPAWLAAGAAAAGIAGATALGWLSSSTANNFEKAERARAPKMIREHIVKALESPDKATRDAVSAAIGADVARTSSGKVDLNMFPDKLMTGIGEKLVVIADCLENGKSLPKPGIRYCDVWENHPSYKNHRDRLNSGSADVLSTWSAGERAYSQMWSEDQYQTACEKLATASSGDSMRNAGQIKEPPQSQMRPALEAGAILTRPSHAYDWHVKAARESKSR